MFHQGREYWVATVAEFERSKLTQERFASRRGIRATTLRSWIYKLRDERKTSVSLVPVRVIASAAPAAPARNREAASIELELRTGVQLRFAMDVDPDYIAALAQRLG